MISKAFKTVYWKEVMENLRDKRTMMSSVIMGSFLGPIMALGIIYLTANMGKEKAEKQLELPVVNMAYAKNLEKHFISQDVKIINLDKSPEAAIKDKDHDAVLVIDEKFGEDMAAAKPAKVMLYYDASAKGAANVTVKRIRSLVNAYSSQIGAMRLQLRGVSPNLMNAVMIENHDQSTAQSQGAQLMLFLPYFLIIGLFMGSMYLAIDTTAGEKERKSLEPLFLNPVSRVDVLSGKLAATVSFGLLTLVLTLIAFKLTMPFYPTKSLGITLSLSVVDMLLMLLILLPLSLLAGSIQTIIAAFSKTFKEAQTYVNLVIFIPLIPSMLLMFMPVKEKLWMMATPILSQNIIINQMIRGEDVSWTNIGVSMLGTLIVGALLAWFAVRLYNKESMLFAD
ncbi:ABC transporter permease [Marinicella sp. S1101]|uniref:ABC transporter permease n=1 Tax=Marinicella marina TaxID=2996016 RepID=UPI002260F45C|nr:ABC transporter permease [Marinicella marina]MCX7554268.1 ABC transporter permease [Marinicella marina]MDJ1138741.1 ABC transporter permease [Marinicella marina]